ncbi:2OG-Fe(II) oxygenase [Erythrobacter aquimaris]|uniref:2OG-Fe(II) oxygenase n=1 Tax=Qipengyuania aquimaris TaxID=255984 RepID=A0A6I4TQ64_9SPHN|nr:2OG-Fe(II) oxygenase [Qipengyuania aquimaris]MXO97201.1 2OG-Fe(II) oxygenase [Qipengyuania aquimaris]
MPLLTRLARIFRTKQPDPKADPATLAAIGNSVRERLSQDSRAIAKGGDKADIYLLPGFLTAQECARLIVTIESRIQPSKLFSDRKTMGARTSSTHFFSNEAPETIALGRKIDEALGIDCAHAETIQGQRYHVGEQYLHHRDYFREERPHWQNERRRGGQRSWTAMVYLNTVEAGGETEFPELDLLVTPETGLLIAWDNMTRKGRPNRNTRHAALPVEAGEKYVITQWYRQEEWSRNYR